MTENSEEASGLPRISAILHTPSTFDIIRKVVLHLHAQSIRPWMELVIACPRADELHPDLDLLEDFAGYQIVEVAGGGLQFAGRAEAIRHARAPVVSMQEDHAYPDAGWGEAILKAFDEGFDAVGPSMLNANPHSILSRAMFLINHHFAMPSDNGEAVIKLPDNNAAYRRDILIEQYGDKLEWWLARAHDLQQDMGRRGHRLCQSQQARLYHLNISHPRHAALMRFSGGRLFGARRSENWSLLRRALYVLGAPLIPLMRVIRDLPLLRRVQGREYATHIMLPGFLAVETVAGLGEVTGYLFGEGNAPEQRYGYEVNRRVYLNASDRCALDQGGLALPIGGRSP